MSCSVALSRLRRCRLVGRCEVHELSSPEDYRRLLLEEGRAAIARGAADMAAASAASAATATPAATWTSAGAGTPVTASSTGGAPAPAASAAAAAGGVAVWPPLSCSYFHGSEAEAQAAMEALWAACHGGQAEHSSTSVPVGAGGTGTTGCFVRARVRCTPVSWRDTQQAWHPCAAAGASG